MRLVVGWEMFFFVYCLKQSPCCFLFLSWLHHSLDTGVCLGMDSEIVVHIYFNEWRQDDSSFDIPDAVISKNAGHC